MDRLIRTKSTGSPVDFAARMDLSERSLYNYLSLLKELGAPLAYSRSAGTYFYRNQGRLAFNFENDTPPYHVY